MTPNGVFISWERLSTSSLRSASRCFSRSTSCSSRAFASCNCARACCKFCAIVLRFRDSSPNSSFVWTRQGAEKSSRAILRAAAPSASTGREMQRPIQWSTASTTTVTKHSHTQNAASGARGRRVDAT